jgi:hypothetical protein
MTMQSISVTIKGIQPLLHANPQAVARQNRFNRAMAIINAKKTRRTDSDYADLADLEVESRLYFDEKIGVYVPGNWMMAAIAGRSFSVAKLGKERVRGAVFITQDKLPLKYRWMNKVKTIEDVVKNPQFRHSMILPQGQSRLEKNMPIFHDWSFTADIEFDDTVLDRADLKRILENAARYVGFGDFRPTFGRAEAEFAQADTKPVLKEAA